MGEKGIGKLSERGVRRDSRHGKGGKLGEKGNFKKEERMHLRKKEEEEENLSA